jgi:hypothetical protein
VSFESIEVEVSSDARVYAVGVAPASGGLD